MRLGAALVGIMLAALCGVAQAQVPLPKDLAIQAPGADVPAADAAFSGAWGNGAWGRGAVPTALVVERIAADGTAQVIYAVGSSGYPKIAAKWLRLKGHIADHRLTIRLPDPSSSKDYRVQYRIVAPGVLEGDFTTWAGWRSHAFLQRIAGPPAAIIATATLPAQPIWRQIWIPEQWEGQTLRLEATLYRTRLPGRQPLVILNHGAASPETLKNTHHYQAQSRFFLTRGYNVVVPMRKGRGRSGGPLGTGIDGAVSDVDAVVNAMRAEPWVDPKRIIAAGVSRGGLLSIIYAARHPDKVAGVINFSGAFGPYQESLRAFVVAAKTAHVPELWLYDKNDNYVPLSEGQKLFAAFRANGGSGDFVTFGTISGMPPGATGEGHTLFEHVGMWKAAVAAYLRRIDGG